MFATVISEAAKGEQLDAVDVQLEATGLIVAGFDMTAVSMTFLVGAVLSDSQIQKDIEAEVAALPADLGDSATRHWRRFQCSM